jgi:sterol desaturase/sphingolipid hydroxylase (fatty acid hydroxylase superfamily)
MSDFIAQHESAIRLGLFFGILAAMALAELAWPRRTLSQPKWRRWGANFGIVVIDTVMLRLLFPVLAVGFAATAQANGWGLFNLAALPGWLEVALAVAALDCLIYWQHRLFHTVPVLWRMHRMHHADIDFDVSTALRFHPIEIALSMLIKLAAVALIGPAPLAVLIFEVLLSGAAMFNHGNLRLPAGLDRLLRLVLVTPDFHRVHHSVRPEEHNANYGFNLPWWDYLFASYRRQPADGHAGMTIGLAAWRGPDCSNLAWMLMLPFRRQG